MSGSDNVGAPIQDKLSLSFISSSNHSLDMINDDGAIADYRREPPAKPKVEVKVAQPDVVGAVLDAKYFTPRSAFEPHCGSVSLTHFASNGVQALNPSPC